MWIEPLKDLLPFLLERQGLQKSVPAVQVRIQDVNPDVVPVPHNLLAGFSGRLGDTLGAPGLAGFIVTRRNVRTKVKQKTLDALRSSLEEVAKLVPLGDQIGGTVAENRVVQVYVDSGSVDGFEGVDVSACACSLRSVSLASIHPSEVPM